MSGLSEPFHILFVDDDQIALELAERALGNERYCITCASTGEEALRLLDVLDVDVVVVDLVMPSMDGVELLHRIKCCDAVSHIPAIAVSGRADEIAIANALSAGAIRFISKPFHWETFATEIRKALTPDPVVTVCSGP